MNRRLPPLETPSWRDERLEVCGFTTRGASPPVAVTCDRQEHGRQVHFVASKASPAAGDALWTTTPGLPIAIRVADCVPILLWDPDAGAVAAIHAGWRGTALDIVGNAVREGQSLGVVPERLKAAIGPSIGPCCFEVGNEVVEALRGCGLSEQEFRARPGPRGRPHIDLRAGNRVLLLRAGLEDENIEDVGGCSHCDAQRYESYRRDGERSGRMHGIIALAQLLLLLGITVLMAAGCKAEEPQPDPDLLISARADAAQQMVQQGNTAEAEIELRALLAERPDDAHLRSLLARALHLQERYTEALVQGRLALGIDPDLWQAAYNLACSSAALGDLDESIRWLQVALRSGEPSALEVARDPDLQSLHGDQRFAFYLLTGILSRAEKDVLAWVHPASLQVGDLATVSLTAIALNRPLMAPREQVEVTPAMPLPAGFIRPISRRETFSTVEEGGREFAHRTFRYTFEVLRSGQMQLGPFEVRQGDSVHWTETLLLRVRDSNGAAAPASAPSLRLPGEFFASPSQVDEQLRLNHQQRGGAVVALDPLSAQSSESPWNARAGSESRYFQFRSAGTERLPLSLPALQPHVFRSILMQRGTEGLSHVAELRPAVEASLRE